MFIYSKTYYHFIMFIFGFDSTLNPLQIFCSHGAFDPFVMIEKFYCISVLLTLDSMHSSTGLHRICENSAYASNRDDNRHIPTIYTIFNSSCFLILFSELMKTTNKHYLVLTIIRLSLQTISHMPAINVHLIQRIYLPDSLFLPNHLLYV